VGPRRAGSGAPRSGVTAVPVGTNLVSPTKRSDSRLSGVRPEHYAEMAFPQ
jgi:hypothetical protein